MPQPDYAALFRQRMQLLADKLGQGSPERLAAELRLPPRNILRYTNGEHQPRLPDARLIALRAGVSLDWLAGLSEAGGPDPTAVADDAMRAAERDDARDRRRSKEGRGRRS